MNNICIHILDNLKEKLVKDADKSLVDKIVNFGDDISLLDLDYLINDSRVTDDLNNNSDGTSNSLILQSHSSLSGVIDYRIKSLSLQDFRTFPNNPDRPYGISFMKKHSTEPCSLFLVGKNGTGKSTIFDALEWIYTGKVRNAENRGVYTHKGLKQYLTYGFENLENISPSLKADIVDCRKKDWNLNSTEPLCVPAICCSDMDIEEISKYSEDSIERAGSDVEGQATKFQKFIRRQLGYDDLSLLQERLEYIGNSISGITDKINTREKLALLTAGDIKNIQKYLKSLCFDEDPNIAKKVRKYSKRKLIKRSSENKNLPKILLADIYPFKDVWTKLKENIKLKLDLNNRSRGTGFIQPGSNPSGPSLEEIDNTINETIDHIAAIHARLNEALDEVDKSEKSDGYNDALLSLNKDYLSLNSEVNDLPDKATDLKRKLVKYRSLSNSIIELNNLLFPTLAHLFEKVEENNEYKNVFPHTLNKFIKQVLSHYCEKGEVFDVKNTGNSFEVFIEVKDKENRVFKTVPQKYFNTFRFRLYAILLKIALAFYYMKENHCLAPIIIDDVFNASDFENSVNLADFVYNVYNAYQEVLEYKEPLQMIILTHDEMIINAFQNGIKMKTINMLERERDGHANHEDFCIFGRLFPYKEAGDIDKQLKKNNSTKEFLNLYLEIGA